MFDLNNSNSSFASIANSVNKTFYPEGQVTIRNTSYYSRDYGNQITRERTFSSYSLTRAMSGDMLYRSPRFANAFYNSSLHSSLNTVITGGSEAAFTTANSYSIDNPEDNSGTSQLKGGAAMARHIADSVVGKVGGSEFVQNAAASIANDYSVSKSYPPVVSSGGNSTTTGGDHSTTGFIGDGTNPGSGARVIVLDSQISAEEKTWLLDRSKKLKDYNTIYDYSVLTGGFLFDLDNKMTSLESTSSHYPGVPDAGSIIPKSIIDLPSGQKAYVCPAMIELLIFLNTKIEIRGGFGFDRANDPSKQGSNLTPLKDGDYVSDHVLGRAFDIDIIGPLNQSNSDKRVVIGDEGANKDRYITALNTLFEALSSAPLHLIPDLFGVSSDLNEEYGIGKGFEADNAKIKVLYPCIKYANFSSDTIHRTHIHMSFSGSRSGIYAGPNGMLAGASTTSTVPGQNNGTIRPAGMTGTADSMDRQASGNSNSGNSSSSNRLADLNTSIDSKNNKTGYGNSLAQVNLETDSKNNKTPDGSSGAVPIDTVNQAADESSNAPAGENFLSYLININNNNPFKPKPLADTTGVPGYTASGDFIIPSDLNSPKFTKDYSNDKKTALEIGDIFALLRLTVMSDEVAAIFAAISEREGGRKPGSWLTDRNSGDWSFGLWGINLIPSYKDAQGKFHPGANGAHNFRIPYPNTIEKVGWQLGYKNWQAEGMDASTFRRIAFGKADSIGKENTNSLFDPVIWYPVNQAYILYTVATGGKLFDSEKLGTYSEDSYVFSPWGDYGGGPPWGWISNVKFATAAGLYASLGKPVSALQDWVVKMFETDGKGSKSAPYGRSWVQGYMYRVSWKDGVGWVDKKVVPPASTI